MATSNTTPIVIPQPFAAQATSENINVIPNGATGTNGASFQEGFPEITRMPVIENPLPTQKSGLPPKQQDFNGIFNAVSQHNFFAQNGGLYSFNQDVSDAIGGYAKNQILWYFPTNGLPIPVVSMIDNNTYNFVENPSYIDGQKWNYVVANTSLNNLSATGQAIIDSKQDVATAVNYGNITNCITKIPQDIKLELNNGALTLKSGSKVYVPNGFEEDGVTPKFDVVVIESDITDAADSKRQAMVWCRKLNGKYYIDFPLPLTYCYSGSTAPTSFYGKLALWYDTNTNLIKYTKDGGATWDNQGHSLPLAIVSDTSIDQIFNGFGYIGSTVFALPGVNGLSPNYKNADGTLKNSNVSINSVVTHTQTSGTQTINISIGNTYINPTSATYDSDRNINVFANGSDTTNRCLCGTVSYTNGKITSFQPKTTFHAVDRNDSSWLSGLGMPSSRYIDLTLGASGSTYTAPANGTVLAIKRASDVGQNLGLKRVSSNIFFDFAWSSVAKSNLFVNMDVVKGEVFGVSYTASGTEVQTLRFYYAEGEN